MFVSAISSAEKWRTLRSATCSEPAKAVPRLNGTASTACSPSASIH
ncbi:hypothetical protein RKD39_004855 [Streptomyces albogriseolus]